MTKQEVKKLEEAVRRMPVAVRGLAKRELAAALRDASTVDDFRVIVLDQRHTNAKRARALWVLRVLNDRGVRAQLPMLLAEKGTSRLFAWEVAKSIVAFQPSGAAATLHGMLGQGNASFREIAAWALGFVGGRMSRRLLESALSSDDDAAVRAQAADALGTLGSNQTVPALIAALRRDRSARVRLSVVHALSEIGDRAALPALREYLNDRDRVKATGADTALRRAIRRLQKA